VIEPSAGSEADLKADAAWWRAEYDRLGRELELMTPGHADAIGPTAVRRVHVAHETALQLAQEAENRLALLHPDAGSDAVDEGPTLF
jgi:hypothetical protein